MDFSDISFTLVVKAPNQRVDDQVVEVKPQWTVRELKKHLSNVYPSQPTETQQRLIYSGKLMQDDKLLQEILATKQHESLEDKLQYIVHLVCSPTTEASKSDSTENITYSNSSMTDVGASSLSSSEGLRHRHHTSSTPVVTETNFVPGAAGPAQPPVHNPMMMPMMGQEMAYTPEQYMFMMQNYYHQMAAHYMQYYQTGAFPTHASQQAHPATHANQAANQIQEDINAAREDVVANENMVMNAQGGMEEDEDDEFGQRDWLDWVYTLSRFMVLISIVYFYSNFTRFIMVFAFFVLVYMYQTGWFVFRRREQGEPQQQQQQPIQQQPQQQQQQQQQQQLQQEQQAHVQQEPQNNHQEQIPAENNTDETSGNSTPAQPQEPPRPGVLATVWCFVSTFFTSLVPQQPQPVNLN